MTQQKRSLEAPNLRLRPLDVVHHVAVGEEQVFGAVVVEVQRACAPAGQQLRDAAKFAATRPVLEGLVAQAIEDGVPLLRQRRDDQVGPAVVIQIFENDPHACKLLAVVVVGDSGE